MAATAAQRPPQAAHTLRTDTMDEDDFSARILGASTGAAKPLSLKSLLEQPVRFTPAQGKQEEDEIKYTPINVKVSKPHQVTHRRSSQPELTSRAS